jgi:hypothetical protein
MDRFSEKGRPLILSRAAPGSSPSISSAPTPSGGSPNALNGREGKKTRPRNISPPPCNMPKNNTQPKNPHFGPSTTSFFGWPNRSAPTLDAGISYASRGTYRLAKDFVSPYSGVRSFSARRKQAPLSSCSLSSRPERRRPSANAQRRDRGNIPSKGNRSASNNKKRDTISRVPR